jgi:hypothetical protein
MTKQDRREKGLRTVPPQEDARFPRRRDGPCIHDTAQHC